MKAYDGQENNDKRACGSKLQKRGRGRDQHGEDYAQKRNQIQKTTHEAKDHGALYFQRVQVMLQYLPNHTRWSRFVFLPPERRVKGARSRAAIEKEGTRRSQTPSATRFTRERDENMGRR